MTDCGDRLGATVARRFRYDEASRRQQFERRVHYAKRGKLISAAKSGRREEWLELWKRNPPPEALPLIDRVARCRPLVAPCEAVWCPSCGKRLAEREAYFATKRFATRFPLLEDSEISFVTINGPTVALGDRRVREKQQGFIAALRNLFYRLPVEIGWRGYFEVSLNDNLHLHAVVGHPGMSSGAFLRVLAQNFPGSRRAHLSKGHADQTRYERIYEFFKYAAKGQPSLKDRVFGSFNDLSHRAGLWLVSRQMLCQAGDYVGVRFAINSKSDYRLRNDILIHRQTGEVVVIPELQDFIRRRRNGEDCDLRDAAKPCFKPDPKWEKRSKKRRRLRDSAV